MGFRGKNLGIRAKSQHLFDGDVPRENSLLISEPKSSVTLFMPEPAQDNTHPKIKIADSEFPLVRSPKILGVYLDTFFSFNNHCIQVVKRISGSNKGLKALAGTSWGQQKETLLMTYKALGRSIAIMLHLSGAQMLANPTLARFSAFRMKH